MNCSPNKRVPDFVIELGDYMLGIKNLSKSYVVNMTETLAQFLEFVNVHKLKKRYKKIKDMDLNVVRSLTNEDIYSFIFFLADSNYSTNSRVAKMEHLRNFFHYLYSIKHTIFQNHFDKIKAESRKTTKIPNYLSFEEAKEVQDAYKGSSKPREIENRAIITMFLNCGLRLSELINLRLKDIDFEHNKFQVYGKGDKERTCYINSITRQTLDDYMAVRDSLDPKDDTLFINQQSHKRNSTFYIRDIVLKAYDKAGIDYKEKGYAVHTLRHTCATLLYKNGQDLKVIQEILGHAKIETTQIYTHIYDKKVKDAMLDHPLGKFKMNDALQYNVAV